MRRPLIIALVGLILISFFEWGINNEVSHYSANQQTNQNQSALFGGPVLLGLRDGIAWLWHWLHDNHDELLVIFTALLFGVTAYLVKYTRGLLLEAQKQFPHFKQNVDAATEAAKAANTSANAVMLAERAYVKMSHHPPGAVIGDEGTYWIATAIKNFGKTPATITNVLIKMTIFPNNKLLPNEPDYSVEKEIQFPGAFLVSGEELNFGPSECSWMSDEDVVSVRAGTKRLLAYGYVDYIDSFGIKHRAGYGRIYDHRLESRKRYRSDEDFEKRSNLVYVAQRGYNYDRQRKKSEGNDWDENAPS